MTTDRTKDRELRMGCWDGFLNYLHKFYAAVVAAASILLLLLWIICGALEIKDEGVGFQHRHVPFVLAILASFPSVTMYTYRTFSDDVKHPVIFYTFVKMFTVLALVFSSVACGAVGIIVDTCFQTDTSLIPANYPCQWSGRQFAVGVVSVLAQILIYHEMKRRLLLLGQA